MTLGIFITRLTSIFQAVQTSGSGRFRQDQASPPGASTLSAVPRARLSGTASLRSSAMGGGRNSAVHRGPLTFVETWNSEADFDRVRLIYANTRGGPDYGVGGAIVAPTSSAALLHQPVDPDGAQVPFAVVTFNQHETATARREGATLPDRPITAMTFSALVGTAAGQDVWTPQLTFTDWIPLRSVERTDGGPGRLLNIRTMIDADRFANGPYTAHRSGIDASDTQMVTGRVYQKVFGRGDLVTQAPDAGADHLDLGTRGQGVVYGVQFGQLVQGATVQAVGDSIVQGAGFEAAPYVSGHIGFAHLACASTSSQACPVTLLQSGVGGEPSLNFYQSAIADLQHSDVAVALIQTWSGNDIDLGSSPATSILAADAAWGRAMHYGELIRRQGGIPIFLSAVPQAPKMGSSAAEAARMSSVERCAVLADRGELTLNLNALLGDGSAIVNYQPQLGCSDNIHPNSAGNRVMAESLAPMILSLLQAPPSSMNAWLP